MIPSIVPKKRVHILILTLLFSSAIFTSTTSIFIGIDDVYNDIYGDRDDIVVIFDQSASTPYTSSVPLSYDDRLQNLDGVIATSPEIIVPVVVDSDPSFIRGVNWSKFYTLYEPTLITGNTFRENDRGSVLIGVDYADRMGLAVGDLIQIGGTIRNKDVVAKVSGIIETGDIHDDEIISSLFLTRSLSARDDDYTHILTQIDKTKTNAEVLIEEVSRTYEVNINALVNNGTKQVDYWKLEIYNYKNKRIHSKYHSQQVNIELPYGEYIFQAKWGDQVSRHVKRLIQNSSSIDLFVEPLKYEVGIKLNNNNSIFSSRFIEIVDVRKVTHFSGYTDSHGYLNFTVNRGEYSVRVWEDLVPYNYPITVLRSSNFTINHETVPYSNFKINGLNNQSVIRDEKGYFTTTMIDNETTVLINDQPALRVQNRIPFNLSSGDHTITLISTNGRKNHYQFTIDPNLKVLTHSTFSNYSHHQPGDILEFEWSGLIPERKLDVAIGDELLNTTFVNSRILIELPLDTRGLINLKIQGYTVGNHKIERDLRLIIEENPDVAGLVTASNVPKYLSGELVPIWYSNEELTASLNDTTLNIIENQLQLPSSSSGTYQLKFQSSNQETSQLIEIIDNYSSEILISNNTHTATLETGITWESDNLKIDFNSNLFKVNLLTTSSKLPIYSSQIIPTVIAGEEITDFEVIHKSTNHAILYNIDISPQFIETMIPYHPLSGKSEIAKPSFSMNSPINENLIWDFQYLNQSQTIETTPLYENNGLVRLPPGVWEITLTNIDTTGEYKWNMSVPIWQKSVIIKPNTTIITEYTQFTINEAGEYKLIPELPVFDSEKKLIAYRGQSTDNLYLSSNVTSSEIIDLMLSPQLYQATYLIEFSNGTTTTDTYKGYQQITAQSSGYQLVSVNGTDFFNNTYSLINRTYLIKPLKSLGSIIIDNKLINQDGSTTVTLFNEYSGKTQKISTMNSSLNISVLPGILHIYLDHLQQDFVWKKEIRLFQQNFSVNITDDWSQFNILSQNVNFNQLRNYTGSILVTQLETGEQFQMLHDGDGFALMGYTYNITINVDRTRGSILVNAKSPHNIVIRANPILDSGNVVIKGSTTVDEEGSYIEHIFTGIKQNLTKVGNDIWNIDNFPVGKVNIFLKQGQSLIQLSFWFEPTYVNSTLSIDDTELSSGNWLGQSNLISSRNASNFNIDTLSGPLVYTQIVLIVEIIVVSIALLINISGVFAGFVSESRVEIKIARNIGMTENQLILSVLWHAKYLITLFSIIGGFLGLGLTNLLYSLDSTILFGHRFNPKFPWYLWLVNIGIMNILAYAGSKIGIWMEESSIIKGFEQS